RSLEHLSDAVARAYVPAKRGYLVIGPPPAQALGVAGALQGTRQALGVARHAVSDPDRHGLDGAVEDVLSLCQAMGLRTRRVGRAEVLSLLWRSVHPSAEEPADLGSSSDVVAALAPREWQETFDAVHSGRVYTRSLFVLEPPDLTSPGWLDELVSLDT